MSQTVKCFSEISKSHSTYSTIVQTFFQFFYHKKKAMLSDVILSEFTLMFRENLIKVTIHLIKHTPFINFGENGKDNNAMITFDIKFAFLFMNGYNVNLFQFWGKNWTVQWVIKVVMYKVRKYIIVRFYYFHRDVIFMTFFSYLSFAVSSEYTIFCSFFLYSWPNIYIIMSISIYHDVVLAFFLIIENLINCKYYIKQVVKKLC